MVFAAFASSNILKADTTTMIQFIIFVVPSEGCSNTRRLLLRVHKDTYFFRSDQLHVSTLDTRKRPPGYLCQ